MDTPAAPLVGSITFTRTIRPADYESASMSVTIPVELNPEWGDKDVLDAYEGAAFLARTTIFTQLGIDASVDEDTGVLVEVPKAVAKVANAFGGTVVNTPPADTGGVPAQPPHDPKSYDPAEKQANQDWARARFAVAPNEFFDNRGNKRNPKAPDVKHKSTGIGVWDI